MAGSSGNPSRRNPMKRSNMQARVAAGPTGSVRDPMSRSNLQQRIAQGPQGNAPAPTPRVSVTPSELPTSRPTAPGGNVPALRPNASLGLPSPSNVPALREGLGNLSNLNSAGGEVANRGGQLAPRPSQMPELRPGTWGSARQAITGSVDDALSAGSRMLRGLVGRGIGAAGMLIPNTSMEEGARIEREMLARNPRAAGNFNPDPDFDPAPVPAKEEKPSTPSRTPTTSRRPASRNSNPSKREMTADELNEISLRSIRGEAEPESTPEKRLARIRIDEATKPKASKGGVVKAASGGAIAKPKAPAPKPVKAVAKGKPKPPIVAAKPRPPVPAKAAPKNPMPKFSKGGMAKGKKK